MDTSRNTTHYRERIPNRHWRRVFRTLLTGILLICLLSACAAPMAVLAAEAGTPPEVTDTTLNGMEVSDNGISIGDIITQNKGLTTPEVEEFVPEDAGTDIVPPTVTETEDPIPADAVENQEPAGERLPGATVDPDVTLPENETTAGAPAGAEPAAGTPVPAEPVQVPTEPTPAADTVNTEIVQSAEPVVLMAAEPTPAAAEDTTWQQRFKYTPDAEAGTITLERYAYYGYKTDDISINYRQIIIEPTATIDGVTYRTQVQNRLFQDAYFITSVIFKDGVTVVGDSLNDMFRSCFELESIDLSGLDTTGVRTMDRMFINCIKLKSLDLSGFDTSAVTEMEKMFTNCYRLESLNVSGWDTSHCTNMWGMFADCMNLKSLDLSSWDTSKVTGAGGSDEGGSHPDGTGMEGMFSVGLEELALGSDFAFRTSCSGLLGEWSDGTTTYAAADLERTFANGGASGTYRRVSLGGTSDAAGSEQETLTLPEGYTPTADLTEADLADHAQRNGQISDAENTAAGQLVKTAEWTDQDAGTADITLRYAVPAQGETRAVYAFGTCNVHGFGADVAILQMLELLDHYDYVDVLTTESYYMDYYERNVTHDNYLGSGSGARQVQFTLSAADGRAANLASLVKRFAPNYVNYYRGYNRSANLRRDNVFNWGSHQTASKLFTYLENYLKENTPAAIYVSCDGSRAFSNDNSYIGREAGMVTLYGHSWGSASLGLTYDDILVSQELVETLAQYQEEGRYYPCICKVEEDYTKAYFVAGGSSNYTYPYESRLLCYASFALINPYYYVHNNAELRQYLSGSEVRRFADFPTVGRALINYGTSFDSQGVDYVSTPLTMTDTVDEGLAIDEEHIAVTVTRDGKTLAYRVGTQVTVDGQNVRVYLPDVSIGEVVTVHIPVRTAAEDGTYGTQADGFRDTNVGMASAVTAAGDTVTVASPQLYKGIEEEPEEPVTYTVTTSALHGTITDPVTGIAEGTDVEIAYAAEEGYHLESVTIDGVAVDMENYPDSYLFADIHADHDIRVVYVQDEVIPEPEDPEEKETPEDPETPTTQERRHHKTVNHTTENYKTVNTTVVNETVTVPAEIPVAAESVVEAPAEPVTANAGPATGDDAQMLLWLGLAGAAAAALVLWVRERISRA